VVNLVISATPVAAAYRRALSIDYVPMLAEAAVGGLVLGGVLSFLLVLHPSKVPGSGPVNRALLLGAVALVLVTLGIEVPSKLAVDVDDPVHWMLVATIFNVLRILALATAVGLVADADGEARSRRRGHAEKAMRR
jgi:hypothetical protein